MNDSSERRFPKAEAYLQTLSKETILYWLTYSAIGKGALAELESQLIREPKIREP